MVVKSDTTGDGGKELKENWPVVEGTSLGTTKIDGRNMKLVAQGLQYKDVNIKSNVPARNREMI